MRGLILGMSLALLVGFIPIESARASSVNASNVDAKSAVIRWKSDQPYSKFAFRINCLDDQRLNRLTKPVVKAKPEKQGSTRILLVPGKKYRISVLGIDGNSRAMIGSALVKTTGGKASAGTSPVPGQSKVFVASVSGQDVLVNWGQFPGMEEYRLTIAQKDGTHPRQSGWMNARRQKYKFIKLKGKTDYVLRLEGRAKDNKVKVLGKRALRIAG